MASVAQEMILAEVETFDEFMLRSKNRLLVPVDSDMVRAVAEIRRARANAAKQRDDCVAAILAGRNPVPALNNYRRTWQEPWIQTDWRAQYAERARWTLADEAVTRVVDACERGFRLRDDTHDACS